MLETDSCVLKIGHVETVESKNFWIRMFSFVAENDDLVMVLWQCWTRGPGASRPRDS